uniref:Uncharacterized protein n=1 Tax=Castor canadensis TaxID=51338 RepID=A0A8C0XN72_CASCN
MTPIFPHILKLLFQVANKREDPLNPCTNLSGTVGHISPSTAVGSLQNGLQNSGATQPFIP